jgi:hypothetical protein
MPGPAGAETLTKDGMGGGAPVHKRHGETIGVGCEGPFHEQVCGGCRVDVDGLRHGPGSGLSLSASTPSGGVPSYASSLNPVKPP